MPRRRGEASTKLVDGRCSVMDSLLLRPLSGNARDEYSPESPGFDCDTPYAESEASSGDKSVEDITTTVTPESGCGLRTPTTRAEQLRLILARNYNSAPACSLDYVHFDLSYSEETHTVHEAREPDPSEKDETEDSNNSRQTINNNCVLAPSEDLESSTVHILRCDSWKGETTVQPDGDQITTEDIRIERDSSETSAKNAADGGYALLDMHNASEARDTSVADDKSITLPLDLPVYPTSVDIGTSPPPQQNTEDLKTSPVVDFSCGVDVSTSPMESAKKSIPVYSRSLLYRIRVPLAQRLRNTCANFGPLEDSTKRVILSTERQSTRRNLPTSESPEEAESETEASPDSDRDFDWHSEIPGNDDSSAAVAYTGGDIFFRKKRRRAKRTSHGTHRVQKRGKQPSGLMVEGEFWEGGSMRPLGPDFGDSSLWGSGDNKTAQLSILVSRHFYLCSEK